MTGWTDRVALGRAIAMVSAPNVARDATTGRDEFGRMPFLSVTMSVGLVITALANTASRNSQAAAPIIFWLGLVAMVTPVLVRLLGSSATRTERMSLVVMLGAALYLVKVFHDPLSVTFADEFSQWRATADVMERDRLFEFNPLLPITGTYPGLPSTAAALTDAAGIEVFLAGFIVIGAARLLFIGSIFRFLEILTGSHRVAGLGVFVYMCNPNFLFYGAEFSYESLALALAAFVLFLAARYAARQADSRPALVLVAVLVTIATSATHHLTSFGLAGFLLLWSLAALALRMRHRESPHPGVLGPIALGIAVGWSVFVAPRVISYLGPVLGNGLAELLRLLAGAGTPRTLFTFAGNQAAPVWEQIASFGAVALILLALPFALLRVARDHSRSAAILACAVVALAYPATLALRLTTAGAETANRSSEFLFLGIGAIFALAAAESWRPRLGRVGIPVLAGAGVVLFLGGVIVGFAPWARLPGPYLVAADTRSVEPLGITTALWTLEHLGPGNRLVADRTNRLLSGTYGYQRPVTGFGDQQDTKTLILSPRLGPVEQEVAFESNLRYVIIDRRLSTSLPYQGIYVERGELRDVGQRRVPLEAPRLAKFDGMAGIDRIFDNGSIQIYDIRVWAGVD
jgi:hypothetical protein